MELNRYRNLLKCLEDGVSITLDKIDKLDGGDDAAKLELDNEEEEKKKEFKLPKHYDPQRFY